MSGHSATAALRLLVAPSPAPADGPRRTDGPNRRRLARPSPAAPAWSGQAGLGRPSGAVRVGDRAWCNATQQQSPLFPGVSLARARVRELP